MITETLTQLGFTPNQAEVYTALAEFDESPPGPLIEKTGFHPNAVGRALTELRAQKLITRRKQGNTWHYRLADPQRLIQTFTKKKMVARSVAEKLHQSYIPQPEILRLPGRDGLAEVLDMQLAGGEDTLLIGINYILHMEYPELFEAYIRRTKKAGLTRRVIAYHRPDLDVQQYFPEGEIRVLPPSFPESPVVIAIFGGGIAHVMNVVPPQTVVIQDTAIAEGYRHYFELLWNITTPLPS